MPQLDFTTYLPQLFWLAVTFAFLYIVMARSALPRVGQILEERQNRIDNDLEQAEGFRTESEKLEADYEKLTADAKAKAVAHLQEERAKVEARLSERQADMTAQLEGRLAEAEGKIADARKKALSGVEEIATEACLTIVAQVSGAKLAKADAKKAVKTSLGAK